MGALDMEDGKGKIPMKYAQRANCTAEVIALLDPTKKQERLDAQKAVKKKEPKEKPAGAEGKGGEKVTLKPMMPLPFTGQKNRWQVAARKIILQNRVMKAAKSKEVDVL